MSQSMPRLTCLRCGHNWTPQKNPYPDRCGSNRCRTPYWDRPRKANGLNTTGSNEKEAETDQKQLSQADLDLNNQLAQLSWENAELTKQLQELERAAEKTIKLRLNPTTGHYESETLRLNPTTGQYEPEVQSQPVHQRLRDYLLHAQNCASCKNELIEYNRWTVNQSIEAATTPLLRAIESLRKP